MQTLCNPGISERCHIDSFGIFRTLTYFKPDIYSEPSQRFKMECFAKIVTRYNYFSKVFYFRSLTGFGIRSSLNKYYLTVEWTRAMYCIRHIQNPDIFRIRCIFVISGIFRHFRVIFRHIQSHCSIFRTLCLSLAHPEPCHIQSPGISRTLSSYS